MILNKTLKITIIIIVIINEFNKTKKGGGGDNEYRRRKNNKTGSRYIWLKKAYLKYNKHIMQQDNPLNKNHYLQNVVVVVHT